MKWALDIDGVIADFNRSFVGVVNRLWPGRVPPDFETSRWDYFDVLSPSDVDGAWSEIKHSPNWWLTLPAYRNNVQAVAQRLAAYPNDTLFFITHRECGTVGLPVAHQTQKWLASCGLDWLGINLIMCPRDSSKAELCRLLEIDAMLDDYPGNVPENDPVMTLLDRPWNRKERLAGMRVSESVANFFKHSEH